MSYLDSGAEAKVGRIAEPLPKGNTWYHARVCFADVKPRCLREGVSQSCLSPLTRKALASRRQGAEGVTRTPTQTSLLRTKIFTPETDQYVRRVGRPCREWFKEVLHETISLFGSIEAASTEATYPKRWRLALSYHLFFV